MSMTDKSSSTNWWNSIVAEFARFADHKLYKLIDWLLTHNVWTVEGNRLSQSQISKIIDVDPSQLSEKIAKWRKDQSNY